MIACLARATVQLFPSARLTIARIRKQQQGRAKSRVRESVIENLLYGNAADSPEVRIARSWMGSWVSKGFRMDIAKLADVPESGATSVIHTGCWAEC